MKINQEAINENATVLGAQLFMAVLKNPPSSEEAAIFYNEEALQHLVFGIAQTAACHIAMEYYKMEPPPVDGRVRTFPVSRLKDFVGGITELLNETEFNVSFIENQK